MPYLISNDLLLLPSRFMCVHSVVAVSTVAQNMAKYIKRKVQAATLATRFRERMGLMSTGDGYDMIHHGMIETCLVSTI